MDFALNKNQQALMHEATAFCREQLACNDLAERDKNEVFAQSLWTKCGEYGLQGLMVDKAYNGKELDPLDTILVLETLGHECPDEGLLFALNAHLLSVVFSVWKYSLANQKQNLLSDLASGKKTGAHCITEQSGGSDVFNMATVAVKKQDGFIINGAKCYITNAPFADVLLIYAITDKDKGILGGITPFIIERDRKGVRVSKNISKMGLRTCSMGNIELDNVLAGPADILGEEGGGFKIFNDAITWERIGMSAMIVGIVSKLIHETRQFAKKKGLQRHQAVMHTLATHVAQLEATRALVYQAAWSITHNPGQVAALAASVKLLAGELYKQLALDAVQIHGACGYVAGNMIEMHARNAVAATLYSGTSEVQKNIISGWNK